MHFLLGKLITNKSQIDFGNGQMGSGNLTEQKRSEVMVKLSEPTTHIYTVLQFSGFYLQYDINESYNMSVPRSVNICLGQLHFAADGQQNFAS